MVSSKVSSVGPVTPNRYMIGGLITRKIKIEILDMNSGSTEMFVQSIPRC